MSLTNRRKSLVPGGQAELGQSVQQVRHEDESATNGDMQERTASQALQVSA